MTKPFGKFFLVRCGMNDTKFFDHPELPVCLGAAPSKRETAQAAKRTKILDAAWKVFKRLGYDGASMNDIADAAKVSKPTLYVYFESKEGLFAAMVDELKMRQAERILPPDPSHPDIDETLRTFARSILRKLVNPEHISLIRLVFSAAEKFPEIGLMVFQSGLGRGIEFMTAYFDAEVTNGRLKIEDTEMAAYQFFELVQARNLRRLMLGIDSKVSEETLHAYADGAVRVFLAAYRA
ncbi:TetR/AcrR family transcriptional regulator [Lacibacterium aquatile]|uniref:TetR/AcrR family transcriptional regulator n=1 Tax=Lacibacterium aquatile TaxID=1168082 RepID=A0ABW5DK04_9PROT